MCKRYGQNNHQELKSEVMAILLELPEVKKQSIAENNYIVPYAIQTLRFQVSARNWTSFRKAFANREGLYLFDDININGSNTEKQNEISDKFVIYKDLFDLPIHELHTLEENEIDAHKVMAKIESDMLDQNNKYFYHSRLLNELINNNLNTKQLSREIGIPYTSVRHAIKEYREHLKEWLK